MKRNYEKILKDKRDKVRVWYGENLETIRIMSGLTLSEISKNTGISVQTLSLIENGKKLPYYQYLVIRKYIDNYLIDTFKYTLISSKTFELDDLSGLLLKPFVSICTSVICNDMHIWNDKEQAFINEQWNQIRADFENRQDAQTAKTYSRIISNEFSNEFASDLMKIVPLFQNIISKIIDDLFSFEEQNYINYIEEQESLSPIDKIILFILSELIYIVIWAVPLDQSIEFSHINVDSAHTNSFKKAYKYLQELGTFPIIDHETFDVDNFINQVNIVLKYSGEDGPEIITMDNIENILFDWFKLLQCAVLILANINDWFYAITTDGINDLYELNNSSSFYESLLALHFDRVNTNIKALDNLFTQIEKRQS